MHPIHLCIGAPRAGTTWLFREMQQHPALFVPAAKEVRFWNSRRSDAQRDIAIIDSRKRADACHDTEDQRRWINAWEKIAQKDPITMEAYTSLMAVKGRPSLDISPSYSSLSPAKIKELRAGLPQGSKVLYLMRYPMHCLSMQIKRDFHLHGMYRGRPSKADLAEFLNTPQQQQRWDYATILNTWRAEFGEDFIALPFDDIVSNPKALTHKVAELLNFELGPETATRSDDDFFHSDQNQNSQLWATSLGPEEKKQMAQAMLPAITTFAAQMPEAGTPWLSKLHKLADHNIMKPAPVDDIDLPTQKLIRMTESIGDNCEYGMWQRHRGDEPSSLFRWAITPIKSLLDFMGAPSALYAKGDLSVHSPGMVHDAKFGFKFHSKLVEPGPEGKPQLLADKQAFDSIYQEEKSKIDHLQVKTFAQMSQQTGLYIIKDNKGLDESHVRRVLAHLLRHNPTHHLLWVEADGDPAFTDIGGGLLRASLPAFAPYSNVHGYAEGGWTSLMTQLSQYEPIAKQIERMQR
jgi:hypothetical protein